MPPEVEEIIWQFLGPAATKGPDVTIREKFKGPMVLD